MVQFILRICLLSSLAIYLVGCGRDTFVTDPKENTGTIRVLSDGVECSTYIPDPGLDRSEIKITYRDINYFIGSGTSGSIKQTLFGLRPGRYSLKIKGVFTQESGHGTNSSEKVYVVNIQELTFL